MKKLILILCLLFAVSADAQVNEQHNMNNYGQPIIRFYNSLPRPVSCFYRDQFTYYTFVIGPHQYSYWYRINGQYQWQCR